MTFRVVAGPNEGTEGTDETDAEGKATFTYTSTEEGTDRIEATFVDSTDATQTSNRATKIWGAGDPGGTEEPTEEPTLPPTSADSPGAVPPGTPITGLLILLAAMVGAMAWLGTLPRRVRR